MDKQLNIISFKYLEVKKTSRIMKMVSYALMMVFILNLQDAVLFIKIVVYLEYGQTMKVNVKQKQIILV